MQNNLELTTLILLIFDCTKDHWAKSSKLAIHTNYRNCFYGLLYVWDISWKSTETFGICLHIPIQSSFFLLLSRARSIWDQRNMPRMDTHQRVSHSWQGHLSLILVSVARWVVHLAIQFTSSEISPSVSLLNHPGSMRLVDRLHLAKNFF